MQTYNMEHITTVELYIYSDNNQKLYNSINETDNIIEIFGESYSNTTYNYIYEFKLNNINFRQSINNRLHKIVLNEIHYDCFPELYKITSYAVDRYNYKIVNIEIYINTDLIEIYEKKSIGINYFLKSSLIEKINSYQYNFDPTTFSNTSYYKLLPKKPANIVMKKFPMLFDYQRKNITKMINIEKNNIFDIDSVISFNIYNKKYHYDFYYNHYTDANNNILNISTSGGILADEMGLGKTLSMIGLIYFNKKNKLKKLKVSDNKIISNASLIIVPSHLAHQWEEEIIKYLPNMNIIKFFTKKDHERYTYQDVIDCDILIVTQQFLMNFNYYIRVKYTNDVYPSSYIHTHRMSVLDNLLKEIIKNKNYEENAPLIEHFNFHRVIIDEGHEIFERTLSNKSLNQYLLEWLNNVSATYKWIVSGTPFTSIDGLKQCLNFINTTYKSKFISNKISSYTIYEKLLKQIMIRSLKSDVEKEISVPGYEEKVIFIEMTENEKKFYNMKKDNTSRETLQQLCCHPLIMDSVRKIMGNDIIDLDTMKDKMINHHQDRIDKYKLKLSKLVSTNQSYHMLKKKYTDIIGESKYILNTMTGIEDKIKLKDEDCVICMDTFDNPTLTPCGHIYCLECIQLSLKNNNKCPQCRKPIEGDLIAVNSKKEEKPIEDINPIIKKYGSKLGKLIMIIRKLMLDSKNKVIIFSQWDDMLSLIGKSLADNDITNTFIRGNVYMRNNAIRKFKYGKTSRGKKAESNVIMLSLENAASGTNLTEATHIIFIEPIDKDKADIEAIEGQAIGRVCRIGKQDKVQIIRIITKDTVEEEIYNKKYL
jgi:SNF2 family DNA or RNA helicase